jgi:hypothetical protein
MEEVSFGLTRSAWNGGSLFWPDYNGLELELKKGMRKKNTRASLDHGRDFVALGKNKTILTIHILVSCIISPFFCS